MVLLYYNKKSWKRRTNRLYTAVVYISTVWTTAVWYAMYISSSRQSHSGPILLKNTRVILSCLPSDLFVSSFCWSINWPYHRTDRTSKQQTCPVGTRPPPWAERMLACISFRLFSSLSSFRLFSFLFLSVSFLVVLLSLLFRVYLHTMDMLLVFIRCKWYGMVPGIPQLVQIIGTCRRVACFLWRRARFQENDLRATSTAVIVSKY